MFLIKRLSKPSWRRIENVIECNGGGSSFKSAAGTQALRPYTTPTAQMCSPQHQRRSLHVLAEHSTRRSTIPSETKVKSEDPLLRRRTEQVIGHSCLLWLLLHGKVL